MGAWNAIKAASSLHPCSSVTRWVLAGHSNGARVAAQMAWEAREARTPEILGLLLMSYPVHPPKLQNDAAKWRVLPLTDLGEMILFIRGSQDDMALPGPFEKVGAIKHTVTANGWCVLTTTTIPT